jgi:hypothetical protein
MVSSLPLMAASLLLGQATDIPPGPAVQPSGKVYVYNNGQLVQYGESPRSESRHPILHRIHGWFGKRNNNTIPSGTATTIETAPPPLITPNAGAVKDNVAPPMPPAAAPTGDYPRKMPLSFGPPAPIIETVSPAAMKSLPTPAHTPILPGNLNRVGRDEKFEWVTGQLEMEKGQYVLYYATPETVDPHHGRIVLNPMTVDMRRFHSGDLISVHGHLNASAVYLLTSADMIEQARK